MEGEQQQNHAMGATPRAASGAGSGAGGGSGVGGGPSPGVGVGGGSGRPSPAKQPSEEHVKPQRKQNPSLGAEISSMLFGSDQPQEQPQGQGGPVHHQSPQYEPEPLHHEPQNYTDVHLGVGMQGGQDLYLEADEARQSSEGGILELVHWLPTLPQLFIMLCLTQMLIAFFWFIADCTEKYGNGFLGAAEDWFQIASWIIFVIMNILCLVYMRLIKGRLAPALTSTLMFFFVFVSLFYAPLTTSFYSRAFQATFTFFRVIFIFVISALYAIAYREDIVPPRDHLPPMLRNFVVSHRLDEA